METASQAALRATFILRALLEAAYNIAAEAVILQSASQAARLVVDRFYAPNAALAIAARDARIAELEALLHARAPLPFEPAPFAVVLDDARPASQRAEDAINAFLVRCVGLKPSDPPLTSACPILV